MADLTDELEKALRDEAYDGGFGHIGDEQFTSYVRGLAVTAAKVVEKALTPTDDEREALLAALYEEGFSGCGEEIGTHETVIFVEYVPDVAARLGFRRTEVPEPSAEGYAEFEDWEQEMFRHQPVLSMHDGSIAGCQCLDRVFVKGREDWGTHLATIITSRLTAEPQGEPSDAQVEAGCVAFYEDATGLTSWRRLVSFDAVLAERYRNGVRRALRAAGGVR